MAKNKPHAEFHNYIPLSGSLRRVGMFGKTNSATPPPKLAAIRGATATPARIQCPIDLPLPPLIPCGIDTDFSYRRLVLDK